MPRLPFCVNSARTHTAQVPEVGCFRRLEAARAPHGAGACVAEAEQRVLAGLHQRGRERQLLFDLLDHAAAAGVDAEVLERELEVGDVGAQALDAQQLCSCG